MKPIKVFSLEEAVSLVRKSYPEAVPEGSTYDWSFWVGEEVVAEMKTNRRSKEYSWKLVIFETPRNPG